MRVPPQGVRAGGVKLSARSNTGPGKVTLGFYQKPRLCGVSSAAVWLAGLPFGLNREEGEEGEIRRSELLLKILL
jgi:hypothetical protein